jgi:hypothetical protein
MEGCVEKEEVMSAMTMSKGAIQVALIFIVIVP